MTEPATYIADAREMAGEGYEPRNERIAALKNDLRVFVSLTVDGAWHCLEDCEAEGRTDCPLCKCIKHAQVTLNGEKAP